MIDPIRALVSRLGVEGRLAVVLPLVAVAGLVLVQLAARPAQPPEPAAPTAEELPRAFLVCPGADGGAGEVTLGTDGDGSGEVRWGQPGEREPVEIGGNRVAVGQQGAAPVLIAGRDEMAPGLFAGRSAVEPAAAVGCRPTVAEQWFTGVGAGAEWTSTLELVNPNPGSAVADVTVLGPGGPVEASGLRGLTVRGGSSVRVPLDERLARRGQLTVKVTTTRGRLGISMRGRYAEVGGEAASEDWLPSTTEPESAPVMLGLADGSGSRHLVIANPGDDQARVRLQLVTEQATLTPAGSEDISVPAQSTTRVRVDDVLDSDAASDAVGIRLRSTVPITASLRQLTDGDLAYATPLPEIAGSTAAAVPRGAARVLLAGAEGSGRVRVVFHDAEGKRVGRSGVDLAADTARQVSVPGAARRVAVVPGDGVTLRAAQVVAPAAADGDAPGGGFSVVPLREVVRTALIPQVGPGAVSR